MFSASSGMDPENDPGIEPMSLMSPALAGGFFITRATWDANTRLNRKHSAMLSM